LADHGVDSQCRFDWVDVMAALIWVDVWG